jgi:hypothetical protein
MRVRPLIGGLAIAFVIALPVARADEEPPTKEQCVASYTSAQELSRSSKLKDARSALLVCARDPCSAVLQKDCVPWLADVEERLPTIVFALRDASGRDIADARVLVDGVVVMTRLEGRAFEIDPGEHLVRIEPASGEPVERTIVAREKEKGRDVTFVTGGGATPPTPPVTPPPPGPIPSEGRPLPTAFWAAAGVGAVAAITFSVFAVRGIVQRSNLDDCKPNCDTSRIDRAKANFVVADVSLVVAALAGGAATWFALSR